MLLEPGGVFTAVWIGAEAKPLRITSNKNYLEGLRKGSGVLLERCWDPTVRMDSAIAVVSCLYDFHVDGVFSHCGLDVFTLVKREGAWRIASCAYSMRKDGCGQSPLGPVKP